MEKIHLPGHDKKAAAEKEKSCENRLSHMGFCVFVTKAMAAISLYNIRQNSQKGMLLFMEREDHRILKTLIIVSLNIFVIAVLYSIFGPIHYY